MRWIVRCVPVGLIASLHLLLSPALCRGFAVSSAGYCHPSVLYAISSESSGSSNSLLEQEEEDAATVVQLTCSDPPCEIVLIGTAHLSSKSNRQVKRWIEQVQPQVVAVELDESRLPRIGYKNQQAIQNISQVVTTSDVDIPDHLLDPVYKSARAPNFFANLVLNIGSQLARLWLTTMYNRMSSELAEKTDGPGGEFEAALQSAQACPKTKTIVLADRSSVGTLKRLGELVLASGKPLGQFLDDFEQVNGRQMGLLEDQVRAELQQQQEYKDMKLREIPQDIVTVASMERIKMDGRFREDLFAQLQQQVPEFTQAFLIERDYVMAESIRRQVVEEKAQSIIAVVGLAHVDGMEGHLRQMLNIKS